MAPLTPARRMQRALVRGVELEYELRGDGEPILLIHGSHISNSFVTLLSQKILTDEFTLVRYHRRGFQGSTPVSGSFSIAEQAADAAGLVDYLGLGPAHVVGHSYGGAIAMQMAVDFPEQTASLILFEAALLTVEGGQGVFDLVDIAQELYHRGNWEAAVDLFLGSPAERAEVSRNVPGGLDGAIRDVDTYFTVEAPAHEHWRFDAETAARLTGPILYLMGANSSELYRTVYNQIKEWAPQTESGVVDKASHLLHIQQPAGAAAQVAAFCRRHPVQVGPAAARRQHLEQRYNATVDILESNLAAGRGVDVAVVTPERTWTYAEISRATNRAGNALRGLGVEMEDRVLMVVADSAEFVTTFFGAMKIGAVPVPVSTYLSIQDYAHLMEETRAKVVVVSEACLSAVREALGAGDHLRHLVVIGDAEGPELRFDELVSSASSILGAADTTREDTAFWVYGLSDDGHPQAVMHLHGAMRACADGYGHGVLSLGPQDRTYCAFKLFHPYGLGAALYLPLAAGATTVLAHEPSLTRMLLHTLRTFRPTVVFGVPTTFASVLDAGRSRKGDEFRGVRLCVSAAEPIRPRLVHRWEEAIGVELIDGLGVPETCHIFLSSVPHGAPPAGPEDAAAVRARPINGRDIEGRDADRARPRAHGVQHLRAVPGFELRLVDERNRPVAVGEVGRLLVRGPALFSGYWLSPQATKAAMHGEWFDTRSLFSVDEDGCYTPHDRQDGVFRVAGTWVSAAEVERVVLTSPHVAECAVFARCDAGDVLQLEALIVAHGGRDPIDVIGELRRRVRIRLGGDKTPRRFHVVDALPRYEDGRLRRKDLADSVPPVPGVEIPAGSRFTG